MEYNYKENIKSDIVDWIYEALEYDENGEIEKLISEKDKDAILEELLWTTDSVTGNGSGSYTTNAWLAQEYVLSEDGIENIQELLQEGLLEEETFANYFKRGNWETLDVIIRCCLLNECLSEVLEEHEFSLGEIEDESI